MKFVYFILLIFFTFQLNANEYVIEIIIANQPGNQVILGSVKGDKFTPVDTISVQKSGDEKKIRFAFGKNRHSGVYRLVLGQTTYARVMNEAPQQLDFIFNYENIQLKTDFKAPIDSLEIIHSEENRIWYGFLQKQKELKEKMDLAEKEIDYYREKQNENDLQSGIAFFNGLQIEYEELINASAQEHQEFFVSEMIKMFRRPFVDGKMTQEERRKKWQNEFFSVVNLSKEKLINSSVLTSAAFEYLMSYARPGISKEVQKKQFIKALDEILNSFNLTRNADYRNEAYEFMLDYLVRGFERLQINEMVVYIAENYLETTCKTDEKTTLERKLGAAKMTPGDIISDFEMNDINGDPQTFSEIAKDTTIIIFWSSWCPHCIEILPQLKSLEIGSNKDVILVSLDTSKTDWTNYVYQNNLDVFYNLCDFKEWDGKTAEALNVYATPTYFVVNKERELLAKPFNEKQLKHWF